MTGWVIEITGPNRRLLTVPAYWSGRRGTNSWEFTVEVEKAIWFVRREDADAVMIGLGLRNCEATSVTR